MPTGGFGADRAQGEPLSRRLPARVVPTRGIRVVEVTDNNNGPAEQGEPMINEPAEVILPTEAQPRVPPLMPTQGNPPPTADMQTQRPIGAE